MEENVKPKWAEVDVNLERRADLIPNLVETVKGFTKEESTVFGDIANARAGLLNAQGPQAKIAANGQLGFGALAGCCADGKLSRNCAPATSSCACRTSCRARKTASRFRGGTITRRSRTTTRSLQQFPNSIWANMLGFHQNSAYFQASEASRQVPQVKF